MNQKINFASLVVLTPMLLIALNVTEVLGQGNFTPPDRQANNGGQLRQWDPPPENQLNVVHPSTHQSDSSFPTAANFPSKVQPFDPGIRTAKLEVPATTGSADSSIDETLDSTAAMFTNLKDATGDKISGLMSTLNQKGSWTDKLKSVTGSADIGKMLGSLALVLESILRLSG